MDHTLALPDEVIVLVMMMLQCEKLAGAAAMVCRRWRRLAGSPKVLGERSNLPNTRLGLCYQTLFVMVGYVAWLSGRAGSCAPVRMTTRPGSGAMPVATSARSRGTRVRLCAWLSGRAGNCTPVWVTTRPGSGSSARHHPSCQSTEPTKQPSNEVVIITDRLLAY